MFGTVSHFQFLLKYHYDFISFIHNHVSTIPRRPSPKPLSKQLACIYKPNRCTESITAVEFLSLLSVAQKAGKLWGCLHNSKIIFYVILRLPSCSLQTNCLPRELNAKLYKKNISRERDWGFQLPFFRGAWVEFP